MFLPCASPALYLYLLPLLYTFTLHTEVTLYEIVPILYLQLLPLSLLYIATTFLLSPSSLLFYIFTFPLYLLARHQQYCSE